MQKFKVNGRSVPKIEWKQMDGRTEASALPFTYPANAVGNKRDISYFSALDCFSVIVYDVSAASLIGCRQLITDIHCHWHIMTTICDTLWWLLVTGCMIFMIVLMAVVCVLGQ